MHAVEVVAHHVHGLNFTQAVVPAGPTASERVKFQPLDLVEPLAVDACFRGAVHVPVQRAPSRASMHSAWSRAHHGVNRPDESEVSLHVQRPQSR